MCVDFVVHSLTHTQTTQHMTDDDDDDDDDEWTCLNMNKHVDDHWPLTIDNDDDDDDASQNNIEKKDTQKREKRAKKHAHNTQLTTIIIGNRMIDTMQANAWPSRLAVIIPVVK
jgi:hypothetical protein